MDKVKSSLDTPDDQTLTPPAVTSSEDTFNVRRVFLSGDKDSFSQQFFSQHRR
jgi:hypothetical protein